jgi:hypothetical protein
MFYNPLKSIFLFHLNNLFLGSEVFTAVRVMMIFIWVLTPCRLAGRRQRFREHTVSIFSVEVAMLESGGIYTESDEGSWRKGPVRDEELVVPFPQPAIPLFYINPSSSWHPHFSPEDGDIMFPWNVSVYLLVYTASKSRKNQFIFKFH